VLFLILKNTVARHSRIFGKVGKKHPINIKTDRNNSIGEK
jgi:hypothetical protein